MQSREEKNERSKEWYRNNKERAAANGRDWRLKNKKKVRGHSRKAYEKNKDICNQRSIACYHKKRERYRELKGDAPCLDCGNQFPQYVMDFHHRDPDTKVAPVSKMVTSKATEKEILEEIEKCDLLCANCHRIREYGS